MKATVMGITVEGDSCEIAEMLRKYEDLRPGENIDLTGKPGRPPMRRIIATKAIWTPRETKKPAKTKNGKSAPFDYGEKGIGELVGFLKVNGGRAFPGAVSKRFNLTPFQRRKLVAAARKAKKVKVGGNKRSTWYEVR